MKKILAILLAAIMTACVFTACSAEKKDDENTKAPEQNQEQVPEDEEKTPEQNGDEAAEELPLDYAALNASIEAFQPMNELDKEVLVTAGGVDFSAATARYVTQYTMTYFDTEEERLAEAENYYKLNAGVVNMCKEYGAGLTPRQVKAQLQGEYEYYKMTFGDSYDETFASTPYTPYFYYLNNAHNYMFSTLFTKFSEDTSSEFYTSIMERAIEEAKASGEYVRAKHILIQFPEGAGEDGSVTDTQKAETLQKITEVYNKALEMSSPEEFDALVNEYNEDPGMMSYTGGYCFTEGKMVPEFEEAAFALEEYGISEPVETTYGYHVIQKLPLEYEGLENTDFASSDIFTYIATEVLMNLVLEEAEDYELVYAENYDERIAEFTAEYEELLAAQENAAE